jgi:hypothetical protein
MAEISSKSLSLKNEVAMPERLIHDVAFAAADDLVETFFVADSEKARVFFAIYDGIREAIENYETKRQRQESRLHPSSN